METDSRPDAIVEPLPIGPLALPGWLLLATLALTTWLGLLLPAPAAFAAGPLLAGAAAYGLGRAGLVRLEAPARWRDVALPVGAALFAAAVVFLYLQTNHLHDCQCHQGYALSIWRGALPPPALHDATAPSAYHFGFDVVAAALHAAFLPPTVEMSLDLASGLALLALGLAAASLLGRWRVPPAVRALGVLLLVFGLGPVFLASLGWGGGQGAGGPDDWLQRWHAGTFLSVVGLAGRRPAVLGVLILVLFLDLLRSGALATPGRRGAWGGALLLGLLVGAAALVAEELLLFGAVGLLFSGMPAARRPSGDRRRPAGMLLVGLVVVVVLGLSFLSGGLVRAFLSGSDGAPALGVVWPGLPSFRGRADFPGGAYWLTLALELGPLPFLLPLLLLRRTETPRRYAVAVLAIVGIGFALAQVLSFGGYDTDLHRLALPLAHVGFLHAPVLLWTALAPRRRLAVGLLAGGAALSLVSAVGHLFRSVGPLDLVTNAVAPPPAAQDATLTLVLAPAFAALAVAALGWNRRFGPHALVAVLGLLAVAGVERLDHGQRRDPWPDAQCTGALQARGAVAAAADHAERLLDGGVPGPVLADVAVTDALMARGRPVLGRARPPEHGRVDPERHAAFVADFDEADRERYAPGLSVLPRADGPGYRFQPLETDGLPDAAPAPVLERIERSPSAGPPTACPSDRGRALSPAQQDDVLALLLPWEPGGPERDGLRVGDVGLDADGFTVQVLADDGEATLRFGGCPTPAPFAATPSFHVTTETPLPAARALVAAVGANDDGLFWTGDDLAVLAGADAPGGAAPSPLPNTLAFVGFLLLGLALTRRGRRRAQT